MKDGRNEVMQDIINENDRLIDTRSDGQKIIVKTE